MTAKKPVANQIPAAFQIHHWTEAFYYIHQLTAFTWLVCLFITFTNCIGYVCFPIELARAVTTVAVAAAAAVVDDITACEPSIRFLGSFIRVGCDGPSV